jgi:tape measure domain-containing protein
MAVEIKISSDSKQAQSDLNKLQKILKNIQDTTGQFKDLEVKGSVKGIGLLGEKSKQTTSSLKDVNNSLLKIESNSGQLTSSINKLGSAVKFLVAGFAGLTVLNRITEAADTFTNLGNRIALVTGRTSELTRAQNELYKVSIRSRGSFENSTEIYSRFGLSLRAVGVSSNDLLLATESVQKAVAISGAGAESARAAIIQLGQGLASGQLRGQELLSVLEQTPRVAQAIADDLRIPFGALRQEAERGGLTTQRVFRALLRQLPQINKEFSLLAPTFQGGLNRLNTAFSRLIVEIDKGFKFTSSIGKLLVVLANQVDEWADTVQFRISIFLRSIRIAILEFRFLIKDIQRSLRSLTSFDFALPNIAVDTSFIAIILSQIDNLLNSIKSKLSNSNLFGNILSSFNDFKNTIIRIFKEIYIAIVGGSYWTDTIDRIIFHTKRMVSQILPGLSDFKNNLSRVITIGLTEIFITTAFTLYSLENIIKSYFRKISNINFSFSDKLKLASTLSNILNLSLLETILILSKIKSSFVKIIDSIKSIFNFEFQLNLAKFLAELNPVITAISNFGKFVIGVFFTIYDKIVGNSYWPDTIDGIVDYAKNLLPRLTTTFNKVKTYLTNLFKDIKESISFESIKLKLDNIITDIKFRLSLFFEGNLDKVKKEFSSLKTTFENLATPLRRLLTSISNFFTNIKRSSIGNTVLEKINGFIDRLKSFDYSAITALGAAIVSLITLGPLFTTLVSGFLLVKEVLVGTPEAVSKGFSEFITDLENSLENFSDYFDTISKQPEKAYEAVLDAFKGGFAFTKAGEFLSKQVADFFGRLIGRAINNQSYSIGENIADAIVFAIGLKLSKTLRTLTAVTAAIKILVIGEQDAVQVFRKIFSAIATFGKNVLKEAGFTGGFADSTSGGLLAAIILGTLGAAFISAQARALILNVVKAIASYFIIGRILNRNGVEAGKQLTEGIRTGVLSKFKTIYNIFGKTAALSAGLFAAVFSRSISSQINKIFNIEDPIKQLFVELAIGAIAFFSARALSELGLKFIRPFVRRFLGIRSTIGLSFGQGLASNLLAGFLSIGAFGGGFGGFLLAEWISKKLNIESEIVNFAIYAGTIAGGIFAGRFIASAIAGFVSTSIWAPLVLAIKKGLAGLAFAIAGVLFGGGAITKLIAGAKIALTAIASIFGIKPMLIALGIAALGSLLYAVFFGDGNWKDELNNIWEKYIKEPYDDIKAYVKGSALYQIIFGDEGWISKLSNFWNNYIVKPIGDAFKYIEGKWIAFGNMLRNSKLARWIFGEPEKEVSLGSSDPIFDPQSASTRSIISPQTKTTNVPLTVSAAPLDERSLPPQSAIDAIVSQAAKEAISAAPLDERSLPPQSAIDALKAATTALSTAIPEQINSATSLVQTGAQIFDEVVKRVGDVIAKGESEAFGGYTAVNLGQAKGNRALNRKGLTELTIKEILARQKGPNKEFNAAGRYQFIPDTLEATAKKAGIGLDTKFDPETQDKLFRQALLDRLKNILPKEGQAVTQSLVNEAINRLAKEWAAVPVATETIRKTEGQPDRVIKEGQSFYSGVGNNKASIPLAELRMVIFDLLKQASEGYATGGLISGKGSGTSDSILARVSNGEFVVNAAATSKNRGLLEAINSGLPGFASGGIVLNPKLGDYPNAVILSGKETFIELYKKISSSQNELPQNPIERLLTADYVRFGIPIKEFFSANIEPLISRVPILAEQYNNSPSKTKFLIGEEINKIGEKIRNITVLSNMIAAVTGGKFGVLLSLVGGLGVLQPFGQGFLRGQRKLGSFDGLPKVISTSLKYFEEAPNFLTNLPKAILDFIEAGEPRKYATGGRVSGPGTGTSDSILARISNGEFIVNAKSAAENYDLLAMINSGMSFPKFQAGTAIVRGAPTTKFVVYKDLENLFDKYFGKEAQDYDLTGIKPSEQKFLISGLQQIDSLIKKREETYQQIIKTNNPVKLADLQEKAATLGSEIAEAINDFRTQIEKAKKPKVTTPGSGIEQFTSIGSESARVFTEEVSKGFAEVLKGERKFKDLGTLILDKFTSQVLDTFTTQLTKELFSTSGFINQALQSIFTGVAFTGSKTGSGLSSLLGGDSERGSTPTNPLYTTDAKEALPTSEGALKQSSSLFGGVLKPIESSIGSLFGSTALKYNTKFGSEQTKMLEEQFPEEGALSETFDSFTSSLSDIFSTDNPLLSSLGDLFSSDGPLGGILTSITSLFGGGGGGGTDWGSLLKTGLSFFGFASGGYVKGPGSGTSDSILARVSNGEFVVNAASTKQFLPLLQSINQGIIPKYAEGGLVGSVAANAPVIAPVTNSSNQQVFNISISGDISRQTKSEIVKMLPTIATGVNSYNRENNLLARGR